MKKIGISILIIILVVILGIGVKELLDLYQEDENTVEVQNTVEDDDSGWEIEAEYSYNGTLVGNEWQDLVQEEE